MDGLSCFSCKEPLANTTPTFKNDLWTVTCPACSVVNKLMPDPDRERHFKVSGAFFIYQRPRQ